MQSERVFPIDIITSILYFERSLHFFSLICCKSVNEKMKKLLYIDCITRKVLPEELCESSEGTGIAQMLFEGENKGYVAFGYKTGQTEIVHEYDNKTVYRYMDTPKEINFPCRLEKENFVWLCDIG